MSRPSRDLFPLDEFRASCQAVLARSDLGDILQLGSPYGYEPLRRYLLEEARAQHLAGPGDDLLIGQRLELGSADRPRSEAELLPDGVGRDGVVAGDHAHVDPGFQRRRHGVLRLGAQRVDHPRHPHEGQVLGEAAIAVRG